ncbi:MULTISPECIES: HAD-IIB family hydrolase [Persephonella]|uniref:HAD-IIB family hydrolase n=1 Tax=Persephonella TaxID=182899 RepID=UPI0001615E74|nr:MULTISPECIES: HAD-IIB family hydrolase [Persephonella]ABX75858.1 glucosyl-3-phosphoglycerate phosphatase [Persephonella marina EX-H1]
MANVVIFTDLDGTLLNHEDYSFKDAIPSLERIKKKGIPLVIVTSKTKKEVELIQKELGIEEPFIVENGAAVFFPKGYRGFNIRCDQENRYCIIKLGRDYREIRDFIEKIKDKFKIKGFGDMTVEEIVRLTDLPYDRAELAKERDFTEPFIIEDEKDIKDLEEIAEKEGFKITKGGRFYHLIGKGQDKGRAVQIVKKVFEENYGEVPLTVGLGDSRNDIPMLREVDIPILIPHINKKYESVNLPGIIKAEYPGSKGWNESIWRILNEIERGCC